MAAAKPVASMTGFARVDGHAWVIEIKSVNGRTLDLRCRFPNGFDSLEALARTAVQARLKRGSIGLNISLAPVQNASRVRLDHDLLNRLIAVAEAANPAEKPRIDVLLTVRGVVEIVDGDQIAPNRGALEAALATGLAEALDRLVRARHEEGARLATVLTGQLDDIDRLARAAGACAALQPALLTERLRGRLAALLDSVPPLPEERLAQEAAVLIQRADIREELDRLVSHIAAARALLGGGGEIGRQLDFLCQEFNREANTLCAKSADVELTRIGLALKAGIEQFREQVQNIE